MESEIEQTHIVSDYFDKKKFLKQFDIIKHASELAQAKMDYFSAHDDNIIRAIDIVETFLRKKHRLCYGGQAINAHLPSKYKFYDSEYSIPDYDFFTPQQSSDINLLVKDLKKAGFTEISAREGMHEGTIKIYVDYIPVADMTAIDPKLYKILSKREFRLDGISYLDANSLRMLMYLELSRPRGEVRRWEKVFERLALFNEFVPGKHCRISREAFKGGLSKEETQFTLKFIVENKRIFAGADLLGFYEHSLKGKSHTHDTDWILTSKKPIIFFSPDADNDAKLLQSEFEFSSASASARGTGKPGSSLEREFVSTRGKSGSSLEHEIAIDKHDLEQSTPFNKHKKISHVPITIKSFTSRGVDLIPSMKIITQGKKSLVFIINQAACHSYFNTPISDGKIMRISSMDTLITLYFSLGLFDTKYFDMGSMECLANQLVQISIKAREHPNKFGFPFISIKCVGHQTSMPSLIRAKVRRITSKKQQLKNLLRNQDNILNTHSRVSNRRITVKK